jgi:prepilin-type N-terminal cleavage/methylation domain-containing protein
LNRGGFTLIELLAALMIMLTALSSSVYLYETACRSHLRTVKLSRALYEARSKMAAAWSAPASAELAVIMIEVPPIRLYSLRGMN